MQGCHPRSGCAAALARTTIRAMRRTASGISCSEASLHARTSALLLPWPSGRAPARALRACRGKGTGCSRECFRSASRGRAPRRRPETGRRADGLSAAYAPRPNSIAYTATKHAVTGLTKTAALDGRKYAIAVGQIDIGNAATEMAAKMALGVPQANGEIAKEPLMDVKHVGESVLYMANMPLSSNVLFHTVMATNMPFVGRC